jgi:8-oxo-dGTP pyrophosphatase MutT (NUDIX family)
MTRSTDNFDPSAVPIRSAATIMLVDDRPDLQVFMMERNANTVFAGGMWVFPGGSVDSNDDPAVFEAISIHRSDEQASALMHLDQGGLAFYVAAIREAFEEAGILLALNKDDHSNLDLTDPMTKARFHNHRLRVTANGEDFIHVVTNENLILDVGQMHYIARWITPMGSARRFDARFFITRMPENQEPRHDDSELVHCAWFSPQQVLNKVTAGEMVLMSPTLRMIKSLAKFSSAEQVIKAAANNLPDERARVNRNNVIILPGDEGYENGDETVETGWVRLRPVE